MTEKKKPCPVCQGKKVISGVCECGSEWHGTQIGDEWLECKCTPEQECPTCHGTGYVK